MSKVHRFYNNFVQKNERQPSIDEIAEALGIEREKVNAALLTSGRHVSMDAPLVEDEDTCMLDLLQSRDTESSDSSLVSDSLKEEVHRALSMLSEREEQVIKMYFGIETPEMGLEEIGQKMGLSRERVRQIKEKSLNILRSAQIGSVLKEYM